MISRPKLHVLFDSVHLENSGVWKRRLFQPPLKITGANGQRWVACRFIDILICTGQTYTQAFDRELSDHTITVLKQVQSETTGKVLLI